MRLDGWKDGWERCKRYFQLNGGGSFGLLLEECHGSWLGLAWLGLASLGVPLETGVISVCRKRAPKVCREAFVTTETSLGRPFPFVFYYYLPICCGSNPNPQVTPITGSNALNYRSWGPTPPRTLNVRNPSAEWGLAPSHYLALSMVYAEDNLDRVWESQLVITREFNRSNGYRENRSILSSTVGPVGPDPQLLEPALP
ncbi:hypothetical protein CRG98_009298 [Punica granatum]|uniref:Uncharacterized protein n=1 Tax=Punica granatum TaxID=22663 RepID=A0A2I0KR56_PUNGR|nr:hypothetical protein CRG98_009298 [Punica granatum]